MAETTVWTPARVYNVYRVGMCLLLLGLHYLPESPHLGNHLPILFTTTLWLYLSATVLGSTLDLKVRSVASWWAPAPSFIVDVAVLSLVVHANGGLDGGLTMLMLVTVAAANIILRGRLGFLIAALATLSMMFEQFYAALQDSRADVLNLTPSAMLGISFFMVSLIIQQISVRLERSETLNREQRAAIDRLEALNQRIVQQMRTGVMVFDPQYTVLMANASANNMFEKSMMGQQLPSSLVAAYCQWQRNAALPLDAVKLHPESPAINPHFSRLDTDHEKLNIIFMEDSARLAREAQQINLVSLGRLSATLAHEIRNPLSAINQAAELLVDDADGAMNTRLLSIISNNVRRIEDIIRDVLDLSRRGSGRPENLNVQKVLDSVCEQWRLKGIALDRIQQSGCASTSIRFDRNQLIRVLDNLIDNALTHGGNAAQVQVTCGRNLASGIPWIKVHDDGKGISPDTAQHLFEPFFTTDKGGNGLGLYIARELCHANHATLALEPSTGGTTFVITFAHPDRHFQ